MFTFTFGDGQECKCGRPLQRCYTQLRGTPERAAELGPERAARERMIELWGRNWCGCYDSEKRAGVHQFDLRYISTNESAPTLCVCSRGAAPDYQLARLQCTWCDADLGALVYKLDEKPPPLPRVMCRRCKREQLP